MPPASQPRKPARARKLRVPSRSKPIHALWPLLFCVALDPFLVRAASILALEGPKPFTLLFPWVEFVHLPIFHFTGETMSTISQWVLYLQFPVYGLLMTLRSRADRRWRALNIGLAVHFGGILLVEILSYFRP